MLASHPDHRYIIRGLRLGFRIGFKRGAPLRSTSDNMQSAHQNPEVIREYLQKELSLGHMLGPFTDTNSPTRGDFTSRRCWAL